MRPVRLAAICIATYRRHDGLLRLLRALHEQQCPDGWIVEVRVINNDVEAETASWRGDVEAEYPGAITAIERRRNIAHARNAAIALGEADAFLFIDDDEVPAAGWLAALLDRIDHADAVFGPVVGRVPEETPRWLVRAGVFDKPGPDHDGELKWNQTRTSSTAVRSEWFRERGTWFDPNFGISGGSDVEFFRRISKQGARFVHERRALVYEDVEADRCSWRAVLLRRYRAGVVHGRMEREQSETRRFLQLCKRLTAGTATIAAGVLPLALGQPGLLFRGVCRAGVGLGAWRGHNPQYNVTRYPARQTAALQGSA